MLIRHATLDDAALLTSLNEPIHQLHVEALPKDYKPVTATDADRVAFFAARLSDADWAGFIAEDAGEAVGYLLCFVRNASDNPFTYAETALVIDQLSVNPQHQRRGIGQALMQMALDLAKQVEARRIVLDVMDFNHEAQAFYRALGFENRKLRMQRSIE